MKQIMKRVIPATALFFVGACNNEEKKAEPATTDTTAAATTITDATSRIGANYH